MMEVAPPPEDRHGTTETEGRSLGFLCDHPDRALYQRDVEEASASAAPRPAVSPEPGAGRDAGAAERAPGRRLKKLVPTAKALALHAEIESKTG